ncbi:Hypothetical protein SCLAV_p0258 (plasmid) [Streptomyces clavuligerus]|uniref:Uncharacterized protein n=1 Tax=Streptomyces clavuligerus TaxID=1901 RepID=D5SIK6_STRCL|nr:Hypothetical protein SCLAV_p0258 [Streptomyces clavuligerus]
MNHTPPSPSLTAARPAQTANHRGLGGEGEPDSPPAPASPITNGETVHHNDLDLDTDLVRDFTTRLGVSEPTARTVVDEALEAQQTVTRLR